MRLHEVRDLTAADLTRILARAAELAEGSAPRRSDAVVGLVFLEASLRTRVGFAAAAHRIGAHPIDVVDRRMSESSMPESIEDTVRTVSGYCEVMVVRSPRPSRTLAESARPDRGWINAGDGHEHPTQALVDLFAIERLAGPIAQQRVALIGDMRMRSARSLQAILTECRPQSLTIVSDAALGEESRSNIASGDDTALLSEATVIVAVGIPHGAAPEAVRSRLRIDRRLLRHVRKDAVVLSPMPVIDEIAHSARTDPRMRFTEQSDLGLWVRMALLEDSAG